MLLTDLAFPNKWRSQASAVIDLFRRYNRFLVVAHERPDGDALSSIAATGFLLGALQKEYILFMPEAAPSSLPKIPLPRIPLSQWGTLPFSPEVVIALDCGELHRVGPLVAQQIQEKQLPIINIDHHEGAGMGTLISFVAPEAAATAQLVASLLYASQREPSQDILNALSLGLLTDTGCFKHSNATAEVYALASWLQLHGANIFGLREQIEKNGSFERLQLWARASQKVEMLAQGAIALCDIALHDLQETHTVQSDTDDFVTVLRDIRHVNVSALIREVSPKGCKFSLRSSKADVCQIARSLGGGGHILAAGGFIAEPLPQAREILKQTLLHAKIDPLP